MQIDWSTLGLQAVNALVLVWLLARFLFRPVADAIAGRQQAAGQLLADAKAAKAAAESERDKAAAETARLVEHRNAALKEAEAEAATEKAALLATAKIEAEQRTEALATEDRAGRLAIDIAGKLLDRLPREARVAAFIDGIAAGLAKLPEGTRASVGADGTSVRLTAARAVTPQEVEACRSALAGVLGHPVLVEVKVEPALIAGIELETPHAVVRNSFRADLLRLNSGLVHHDTDAA
jgi:F-type H+-transporting ATPase subunit b